MSDDAPSSRRVRRIGLVLGALVGLSLIALPSFVTPPPGLTAASIRALGVTAWVAIWWVTEAIPLAATALLPAALFPLLGVASAKEVAPSFAHPFVLLLLGGFMLARAIEHTGAHRRIALSILWWVGPSSRRLVLGFALSAMLLSMWISNTATALILTPVAMAIVTHAETHAGDRARAFGAAVVLAVAYGATIGGLGTPVGTVGNLIAIGALRAQDPGAALSFAVWASAGVPIALTLTLAMVLALVFVSPGVPRALPLGAAALIRGELDALGPWRTSEKRALGLFAVTALAWITREDLVLGDTTIPGWASILGLGRAPDDGTIALAAVVLAFLIPSGDADRSRLLTWPIANKAPWDLFLLFGGGIAIALGFQKTGVSAWLGTAMGEMGGSTLGFTLGAVLITIFATELISNTALANLLMPVVAAVAPSLGADPRLAIVSMGMACSAAFMMPAGTGPNAIAFGSGRVRIADMAKAGLLVNLAAWVVIAGITLFRFG